MALMVWSALSGSLTVSMLMLADDTRDLSGLTAVLPDELMCSIQVLASPTA